MSGALVIERDLETHIRCTRVNTDTSSVATTIQLGNDIPDGTVGSTFGLIRLYGKGTYPVNLRADLITSGGTKNIFLPNASGTVALQEINNNFTASQVIDKADGTTSALGTSQLRIGNATPEGTAGNSYGEIVIYGKGSYYTNLRANFATANRTIQFPNADATLATTTQLTDGSVTKVGTDTLGSANKPVYLNAGVPTACNTFVPAGGGTFNGAAGTAGGSESWTTITIGNNTGRATAGHSNGRLRLYRSSGTTATTAYYTEIRPYANTANRTITFPDSDGTVLIDEGTITQTGNGSKTYETLLNAIYASINTYSLTHLSKIVMPGGTIGTLAYRPSDNSIYLFTVSYFDESTGKSKMSSIGVKSSGSYFVTQNGEGVVVNNSSGKVPNGEKIILYYN